MSGDYDAFDHEPDVDEHEAAEIEADRQLDAEREDSLADVILPRKVDGEDVSPVILDFHRERRERRIMDVWSVDDDGPQAA